MAHALHNPININKKHVALTTGLTLVKATRCNINISDLL